jgi:hypothetical protein
MENEFLLNVVHRVLMPNNSDGYSRGGKIIERRIDPVKYQLKLSFAQVLYIFCVYLLIGFVLDKYFFNIEGSVFEFVNFTISIPLTLFFLIFLIKRLGLRNKIAITLLLMLLGAVCVGLTFWIFDIKEGLGYPGDMWGLVYVLGLIPSLLISGCYGLYLAFQIKEKGPVNPHKLAICAFLILVVLKTPASAATFKGKVIDADTKQPIESAVVVASWLEERATPTGSISRLHDVKETLTDPNGEWVIEGPKGREGDDVTAFFTLITGTYYARPPEFVIFKPGYCSWPGGFGI